MKVLVVIRRSPARRFLIEINNSLIKEVRKLLSERRNSKAIAAILAKGTFEKEVYGDEIRNKKADMILTEESVHWDLVRK